MLSSADLVKLADLESAAVDADLAGLHGTNVTRFAGSQLFGSAPGAQIVNMCIGSFGRMSKKFYPDELSVIMALTIMLAWHEMGNYDLAHSVINCSWAISVPFLEAVKLNSSITKLYRSIISFGGNIVPSAGNANPNQSKVTSLSNSTLRHTHRITNIKGLPEKEYNQDRQFFLQPYHRNQRQLRAGY